MMSGLEKVTEAAGLAVQENNYANIGYSFIDICGDNFTTAL